MVDGKYRHSPGGQRNAFVAQLENDVTGEDVLAADDNHFLDSPGEVELSFPEGAHISCAVKRSVQPGDHGFKGPALLRVFPVSGADIGAPQADLPDFSLLAGGPVCPHRHHLHIRRRAAQAHDGLFPVGVRLKAALPVLFQRDGGAAVITAGQGGHAYALRQAVAGGEGVVGQLKQPAEAVHCIGIHRLRAVDQPLHVAQVVCGGILRGH